MIGVVNLSDQIYDYVKAKILNKQYKPRERISYDELCKELGISKTPLRDAFISLEKDGLVDIKPRSGTFIAEPKEKNIIDVYDVRKSLECLALDLAFNRLQKKVIEELIEDSEEIAHLLQNDKGYSEYFLHDRKFHSTIIQYSENNYVIRILNSLEAQIQWFSVLTTSNNSERPILSNMRHQDILKAILNNDKENAIDLLATHIEEAKKLMLEDYGEYLKNEE